MAHPALDSEGHLFANYGMQAVLHWVQRNAARFGGNLQLVTLGGQSAGAQDTGINMISTLSTGLFQRAIFESSPLNSLAPLSIGLTNGMNFAAAAGCPGTDATPTVCEAFFVCHFLHIGSDLTVASAAFQQRLTQDYQAILAPFTRRESIFLH